MVIQVLSWMAIVILSISYWFQIWKIHVHREVRDISLTYNVLLAIGFGILGITAYQERSIIFLVKQIMTTLPVLIIILQVVIHRKDQWHDNELPRCKQCHRELEETWKFCAGCGLGRNDT